MIRGYFYIAGSFIGQYVGIADGCHWFRESGEFAGFAELPAGIRLATETELDY